jgi:DNA-binding MarR family transcriptional regulator
MRSAYDPAPMPGDRRILLDMTDRRLAIDTWESLFRAQHEIFGDINGDFEGTMLSQAEYDVLLTVTRGADMTARLRDVTSNMLISQPSVSRLVDRMVSRGLISKCPDPDDGRGSLVRATEDGAAAFRRLASQHGRAIAERMSLLSDGELAQLRELTAKLRKPKPDPDC